MSGPEAAETAAPEAEHPRNLYGRRRGKALRPRQRQLLADLLPRLRVPGVAPPGDPSRRPVDPRTLFPLDIETIVASVRKTGRLVVAHEAGERGGFAAEVAAQVAREAFDYLDAPIERVCAPDVPPPFARELEGYIMVTEEKIAAAVRKVMA